MAPDEDVAVELVAKLSSGAFSRRGPFTVFNTADEGRHIGSLIGRVIRHVENGGSKVWFAPSPWHAALWLYNLAAGVPGKAYVYPPPGGEALVFESALLFRGQRKAQWEVSPSLFRNVEVGIDGVVRQLAGDQYKETVLERMRSMNRFVLAIDWLTSTDGDIGPLPRPVHVATAQHYGLPTHLLDFSTDPLIATWFACFGAEEQDIATVYWLPFVGDGFESSVILAPPWVRRLHRQRGVFLDCSDMNGSAYQQPLYRIVFPASPSYCGSLDDMEPMYSESEWFSSAVYWAKQDARATDDAEALAKDLVATAGYPPFTIDAMIPANWGVWLASVVEFCEWIAIRDAGDHFDFECEPLQAITHNNPHLVSILRFTFRFLERHLGLGDLVAGGTVGSRADSIIACLDL
jgi:hypothetical protein